MGQEPQRALALRLIGLLLGIGQGLKRLAPGLKRLASGLQPLARRVQEPMLDLLLGLPGAGHHPAHLPGARPLLPQAGKAEHPAQLQGFQARGQGKQRHGGGQKTGKHDPGDETGVQPAHCSPPAGAVSMPRPRPQAATDCGSSSGG